MKFTINGSIWTIKEMKQEEFWKDDNKINEMNNNEYFFGRTKYEKQEIWIDESISEEQKRKTLIHELVHCYKSSYVAFTTLNGDEELWCDLVANSHDIIQNIIDSYEDYKRRSV